VIEQRESAVPGADQATWTFPMWPGTLTVLVTRLPGDPDRFEGAVTYGGDVLLTGPAERTPDRARAAARTLFVSRVAALLAGCPADQGTDGRSAG
jgi:hypothetical protein